MTMICQLILADKFDPYKLVYEECLVFNPGAFARSRFSWSTYYPQLAEPKDRMEERYVCSSLARLRSRLTDHSTSLYPVNSRGLTMYSSVLIGIKVLDSNTLSLVLSSKATAHTRTQLHSSFFNLQV